MTPRNKSESWTFATILALAGFLVLLSSRTVFAAPSAQKHKPRVIQLKEIQVEGRVQKPNAFYILNRSRVRSSTDLQDQHFLRKSVDVVREPPF